MSWVVKCWACCHKIKRYPRLYCAHAEASSTCERAQGAPSRLIKIKFCKITNTPCVGVSADWALLVLKLCALAVLSNVHTLHEHSMWELDVASYLVIWGNFKSWYLYIAFTVAEVIYSYNRQNNNQVINVESKDKGYIVSHDGYGQYPSTRKINATLTLTGLRNKHFQVTFIDFYMADDINCTQRYLKISIAEKLFCGEQLPSNLTANLAENSVTFHLYSSNYLSSRAFMLLYVGK